MQSRNVGNVTDCNKDGRTSAFVTLGDQVAAFQGVTLGTNDQQVTLDDQYGTITSHWQPMCHSHTNCI